MNTERDTGASREGPRGVRDAQEGRDAQRLVSLWDAEKQERDPRKRTLTSWSQGPHCGTPTLWPSHPHPPIAGDVDGSADLGARGDPWWGNVALPSPEESPRPRSTQATYRRDSVRIDLEPWCVPSREPPIPSGGHIFTFLSNQALALC